MPGGVVTFGGNWKGLITGVSKVYIPPYLPIDNVLLVKGLKHNLLSIIQLCDNGYNVTFNMDMCIIQNKDNPSLFLLRDKEIFVRLNLVIYPVKRCHAYF